MSSSVDADDTEVPPRDNRARHCRPVADGDQDPDLPDHLDECTCPNHSGVCRECGFKITIGPSGTEYGHARRGNRDPDAGVREDCPYRPSGVDPGRPGGGAR